MELLSTGQGHPYNRGGFRQGVSMMTREEGEKCGLPHIAKQEKASEHSTQVKQPAYKFQRHVGYSAVLVP